MKISELKQRLVMYENNKGWTKQLASTVKMHWGVSTFWRSESEQIELLRQYINDLDDNETIKYDDFINFCSEKNKGNLFNKDFFNTNTLSARLLQDLQREDNITHNKQNLTHRVPIEIYKAHIFNYFNKKELKSVANTCIYFWNIIRSNQYSLFKQASFPSINYAQELPPKRIKINGNKPHLAIAPNGDIIIGFLETPIINIRDTKGKYKLGFTVYERITLMAVMPNGDIITFSGDKRIRIFDPKTGIYKQTFSTIIDYPSAQFVSAAPNGAIIVANHSKILILDGQTGELKLTLSGHNWVNSITVAPNGDIVSGSMDNTIRIWDPLNGKCKQILSGHTSSVESVAVTPKGDIVSGSMDNTIRIWDPVNGECKQILYGHSHIESVAVTSNGNIVSASLNGTIRIWDALTGICLKAFVEGEKNRKSMVIAPNGDIVSIKYSGSKDNSTLEILRFGYVKTELKTVSDSIFLKK